MIDNQPPPSGQPPEGMRKSAAKRISMVHSLVEMGYSIFDDDKERDIDDEDVQDYHLVAKLYSAPEYLGKKKNSEYQFIWGQFQPLSGALWPL